MEIGLWHAVPLSCSLPISKGKRRIVSTREGEMTPLEAGGPKNPALLLPPEVMWMNPVRDSQFRMSGRQEWESIGKVTICSKNRSMSLTLSWPSPQLGSKRRSCSLSPLLFLGPMYNLFLSSQHDWLLLWVLPAQTLSPGIFLQILWWPRAPYRCDLPFPSFQSFHAASKTIVVYPLWLAFQPHLLRFTWPSSPHSFAGLTWQGDMTKKLTSADGLKGEAQGTTQPTRPWSPPLQSRITCYQQFSGGSSSSVDFSHQKNFMNISESVGSILIGEEKGNTFGR